MHYIHARAYYLECTHTHALTVSALPPPPFVDAHGRCVIVLEKLCAYFTTVCSVYVLSAECPCQRKGHCARTHTHARRHAHTPPITLVQLILSLALSQRRGGRAAKAYVSARVAIAECRYYLCTTVYYITYYLSAVHCGYTCCSSVEKKRKGTGR